MMYQIKVQFKDGGLLKMALPKRTDATDYGYREWCVSIFEGKKYLPEFSIGREIETAILGFSMGGVYYPIAGDIDETERLRNLQRELAYFRKNKWEVKVDTVKMENGGEIRVIQRKVIEA